MAEVKADSHLKICFHTKETVDEVASPKTLCEQESALPLYKSSLSESLGSENVACMFIELG